MILGTFFTFVTDLLCVMVRNLGSWYWSFLGMLTHYIEYYTPTKFLINPYHNFGKIACLSHFVAFCIAELTENKVGIVTFWKTK